MKKLQMLVAVVALAGSMAWAGNPPVCVTGTLADYEALESTGGCTIGAVTFVNFGYPFNSGDTAPIPASAITVTPTISNTHPKLRFTAKWPDNANYSTSIRYTLQISSSESYVSEASLGVAGGEFNGGTLSVTDSACLGSLVGCGQPRPLNAGIPVLLQVNLIGGSSTITFPGLTQTFDHVDSLVISQDPGPTAISTITDEFVVVNSSPDTGN
jgi:hypothetical protein